MSPDYLPRISARDCGYPFTYLGGLYHRCLENLDNVTSACEKWGCYQTNYTGAVCAADVGTVTHMHVLQWHFVTFQRKTEGLQCVMKPSTSLMRPRVQLKTLRELHPSVSSFVTYSLNIRERINVIFSCRVKKVCSSFFFLLDVNDRQISEWRTRRSA